MFDPRSHSQFGETSSTIAELAPMNRAVLRCRETDIESVSEKLGLALPRGACQSTSEPKMSALWIGPDEWLILVAELKNGWALDLSTKLEGELYSLVDISHRQVALSIQGPRAEEILASGCALDLSPLAFPEAMCTRTIFAKAEIVLWRTGPLSFHLEVWRSFARYIEALLREAQSET